MENQNKKLRDIVVANILSGNKFNTDRILELLAFISRPSIENLTRCLCYLTGQIDLPTPASVVTDKEGRVCYFKSYNIFNDKLIYAYTTKSYHCFKTQEDADNYEKTGSYGKVPSAYTRLTSEEFPFLGSYDIEHTSDCPLACWENWAVVEEQPLSSYPSLSSPFIGELSLSNMQSCKM